MPPSGLPGVQCSVARLAEIASAIARTYLKPRHVGKGEEMLDSGVVGVVIGLILIYFLLSLLVRVSTS